MAVLRGVDDAGSALIPDLTTGELVGADGRRYAVVDNIPSMVSEGPENQDWNYWDQDDLKKIGDSYYQRAKGDLEEKEAAKSYARLLARDDNYRPGETVLDIGCATGHFLRSFRRLTDIDMHYTGIDTTLPYLRWGAEIFGIDDKCTFVHADALKMPFVDDAFDVVVVNLFHFFEDIGKALGEAMRVARRRVIWRTPIGQTNYMVKVVYDNDFEKLGVLLPERRDMTYSLYMLYSRQYLHGLAEHLGGEILYIDRDTDFGEFDNTALDAFDGLPATKVVNGMQINGALVLDWHYVGIGIARRT
jgi:ubiquinone/menaquinone biosynthesis C-methylase UbiE